MPESALKRLHTAEAKARAEYLAKPQSSEEVKVAVHGLLDATFNGYVGPRGPRGMTGAAGPPGSRGAPGEDGFSESGLLNFIYPVGSVVITGTPGNPGVYLGGTWQQLGVLHYT